MEWARLLRHLICFNQHIEHEHLMIFIVIDYSKLFFFPILYISIKASEFSKTFKQDLKEKEKK